MATKKKLLEAAAGSAGGAGGLNVEDVFSTYLYKGTDSTQTITNGIDLDGEGGLVWLKSRGFTNTNTNLTGSHALIDTERGNTSRLLSNTTDAAQSDGSNYVNSFNSDGFTVGTTMSNGFDGGHRYTSWTFRKAPKFFTCVTYSGTGSAQNISHDLGSDVGFMVVKRTDTTGHWIAWHKDFASTADGRLLLNTTDAYNTSSTYWNSTAPTSTGFTVGTNVNTNASGGSYVAYLFAHNDGDGDFGSTADQDIIKCGSYTGNGSTSGPVIDLGWEPQWLMIKRTDLGGAGYDWFMFDAMRGMPVGGADLYVDANSFDAETGSSERFQITPTGFKLATTSGSFNASGGTYIYIAIRRGPMAVPTSATDVFDIATRDATHPSFDASFDTVDFSFVKNSASTGSWRSFSRLQGQNYMSFDLTNAEALYTAAELDHMYGWSYGVGTSSTFYSWMWKRAPNFFDVVAYTGNGVAGRTVSHNLGVAPEMMWVKQRNVSRNWVVYSETLGAGKYLKLNDINATITNTQRFDTAPTEAVFTVGNDTEVNGSGGTYIAYLFASLDGASKVGSFSHTFGSDTNVDCGFSSGARFVLVKRYDATGNWTVWDTARGIVAGNDPRLFINSAAAENTATDAIDPYSLGFTITGNWLATGNYIFYAIA